MGIKKTFPKLYSNASGRNALSYYQGPRTPNAISIAILQNASAKWYADLGWGNDRNKACKLAAASRFALGLREADYNFG